MRARFGLEMIKIPFSTSYLTGGFADCAFSAALSSIWAMARRSLLRTPEGQDQGSNTASGMGSSEIK
jgi:hypothetical protein